MLLARLASLVFRRLHLLTHSPSKGAGTDWRDGGRKRLEDLKGEYPPGVEGGTRLTAAEARCWIALYLETHTHTQQNDPKQFYNHGG